MEKEECFPLEKRMQHFTNCGHFSVENAVHDGLYRHTLFLYWMLVVTISDVSSAAESPGEFIKQIPRPHFCFPFGWSKAPRICMSKFPRDLKLFSWMLHFANHWLIASTCTAPVAASTYSSTGEFSPRAQIRVQGECLGSTGWLHRSFQQGWGSVYPSIHCYHVP